MKKIVKTCALASLLLMFVGAAAAAQDKTTGGVRGRVRVEAGSPSGVSVVVRRGESEVTRATTNERGDFEVSGLRPGSYGLTFRKAGLKVGKVEGVEVRAGKVKKLGDGLLMSVDEGSLALIQGSVFDQDGRSVPGARVEIHLLLPDGTARRLDSRVSSMETGRFVFKMTPEAARYRLTATAPRRQPAAQEIDVDGAAVYRVALSLAPAVK